MAHFALRLRRSLPITATLRRSFSSLVPALSSPALLNPSISFSSQQQSSSFLASIVQSRPFRSYPTVSLSSTKTYHMYKEGDDITEDTILFEGCDYNHWVILMDFPKDSTPEEMVKTYEETCAKGLNISLEEAKQKIYACSTTTYQGFQAVMTEQESEKFQGLPGVILVLPDSYIDAEKKEYAGDKYINGTIIPKPHPIQRNTKEGLLDQNENPDRPPGNDQHGGPMQNQQNYTQNDLRQGDGRNHKAPQNNAPQQNYPPQQNFPPHQNYPPQQNFGTPSQGEKVGPMPMNPNRRESFQGDRRGLLPPHPRNYNQGEQGNYYPPQGSQSGYGERNFVGNYSNYALPSHSGTYWQGTSSNYGQSYGGQVENQRFSPMEWGNIQGEQRNYAPVGQTVTNQGERGNYYPPQGDHSGYGERNFAGNYSNYGLLSHSGTHWQGTSSYYGQSYGGQGENQRFSPMEWGNIHHGERGNYFPPQGNQSSYGERNFVGNYSNYALPSHGGTYGQGTICNYGQSYGGQGENHRFLPMEQGNVQGVPRNYAPVGQTVTNQGERGNYYPPQGNLSSYGVRNFVGNYSNYALPSHGGTYGQGTSFNYGQSYGGQGENHRFLPMEQGNVQGVPRNYVPVGQTVTNQVERGNYYPPQGNLSGYGERNFVGNYSNYAPPSHGGTYGQGTCPNFGHSYRGQGGNQRFSPMEQRNLQGEQRNYPPVWQIGTNQGRY